jgi:hypothetical protein
MQCRQCDCAVMHASGLAASTIAVCVVPVTTARSGLRCSRSRPAPRPIRSRSFFFFFWSVLTVSDVPAPGTTHVQQTNTCLAQRDATRQAAQCSPNTHNKRKKAYHLIWCTCTEYCGAGHHILMWTQKGAWAHLLNVVYNQKSTICHLAEASITVTVFTSEQTVTASQRLRWSCTTRGHRSQAAVFAF